MKTPQQIERERTRTAVIDGYRVYVQHRESLVFGRTIRPGTIIHVTPTSDPEPPNPTPDTDTVEWEVVMAGDVEALWDSTADPRNPPAHLQAFQAPTYEAWDPDAINQLGQPGAVRTIWPDDAALAAWTYSKIKQVIDFAREVDATWAALHHAEQLTP